jgi:hypothetical protein
MAVLGDLAILDAKHDGDPVANAHGCSIAPGQNLIDRSARKSVLICPATNTDSFAQEFGADLLRCARASWFHQLGSFYKLTHTGEYMFSPIRVNVN